MLKVYCWLYAQQLLLGGIYGLLEIKPNTPNACKARALPTVLSLQPPKHMSCMHKVHLYASIICLHLIILDVCLQAPGTARGTFLTWENERKENKLKRYC